MGKMPTQLICYLPPCHHSFMFVMLLFNVPSLPSRSVLLVAMRGTQESIILEWKFICVGKYNLVFELMISTQFFTYLKFSVEPSTFVWRLATRMGDTSYPECLTWCCSQVSKGSLTPDPELPVSWRRSNVWQKIWGMWKTVLRS